VQSHCEGVAFQRCNTMLNTPRNSLARNPGPSRSRTRRMPPGDWERRRGGGEGAGVQLAWQTTRRVIINQGSKPYIRHRPRFGSVPSSLQPSTRRPHLRGRGTSFDLPLRRRPLSDTDSDFFLRKDGIRRSSPLSLFYLTKIGFAEDPF